MTGKGHLASGTTLGADALLFRHFIRSGGAPVFIQTAADTVSNIMTGGGGTVWQAAAGCALLCVGYYIGVLLPDIDKDNSMISKMIHFSIPVRHRGITHSLWALVLMAVPLFFLPAAVSPFIFGILAGMMVHLLIDSISTAGWVPFYPLGRWKVYNNTVMTKRRHIRLYSSTNPGSEDVVNGLLIVFSVCVFGFWAYLIYWPA